MQTQNSTGISRFAWFFRRVRHFGNASHGATMIEYAIAFPIFLMFLWGVIEMSLISFGNSAMNNVILETSRMSMIGCWGGDMVGNATTKVCNGEPINRATIATMIRRKSSGLVNIQNGASALQPTQPGFYSIDAYPIPGIYANVASIMNAVRNNNLPNNFSLGQGGQTAVIRIRYNWPVFFPLLRYPSGNGNIFGNMVRYDSFSVVRNTEFGTLQNRP